MNRFPRVAAVLMSAAVMLTACAAPVAVVPSPGMPAASGDSGSASLPVGSTRHTIEVDGQSRSYLVYRPAVLEDSAALVMMLHGGYGSAKDAEARFGWDAEADTKHFLVVYPDGEGSAWNVGGGCCGAPGRTNVDDVAFLTAVVHEVESALPIDPARVYATGFSNGAMMSYRLACDTSLFAAIGPVSATVLGDCTAPHPVSVIAIHGTADQNIPYEGGQGTGSAKIDGPAIPAVNQLWRSADSCGPPNTTTAGVVTTSTAACPTSRTVELITIAGSGHEWPGMTDTRQGSDPPYPDLDATKVIWDFFAAH